MVNEERTFTIKGNSMQECKEKLHSEYGNNYKIIAAENDFEKYGFLKLRTKPIKVVTYSLNHQSSFDPDNYFINNRSEEEELEKNRQAILKEHTSTVINTQIKEVNKTLEEFKAEMSRQIQTLSVNNEVHETIKKIDELLEQNEFSFSYIRMIEDKIRTTFSLDQLEDYRLVERYVLDWIGESITIAPKRVFRPPHVIIIVGPTGVGKTTTIEKLASNTIIDAKNNHKNRPALCIVTIDIMKAGALEQLQRVGEILGEEIKKAECAADVQQIYEENKDHVDYIFIDTSGYSPNDSQHIGDMKRILDVQMNPDIYLSVSASTKTSDLINIFRNYEPFAYESVIVTKADETTRFGNIISVLWEKHKSISYITDGQGIPRDIRPATVIDILRRLNGFNYDKIHIEDKFGEQ